MNYDPDVRAPIPALEHSKFIEIKDDTRYPAVSVTRIKYPESSLMSPISTIEVYPKHAVLAYIANPEDISGGGGGGTTNVTVNLSSTNALLNVLTAQGADKVTNWSVVSALVTNTPTSFPSASATVVAVLNNTGVGINIQNGSNLPAFPLPYGGTMDIYTIGNANEIFLSREDGLNIPVAVFGMVTFKP